MGQCPDLPFEDRLVDGFGHLKLHGFVVVRQPEGDMVLKRFAALKICTRGLTPLTHDLGRLSLR